MTIISVILWILTIQMVLITVSFLCISTLFHKTYILQSYIRFLLKERGEKYWDISKAKMVLPNIKDWDKSE